MFYRSIDVFEKDVNTKPDKIDSQNLRLQIQNLRSDKVDYTLTGNLNTLGGIDLTVSPSKTTEDASTDLSTNETKETRFSPNVSWQLLPVPYVSATNNNDRTTWQWALRFRIYDYTPLILMFLTLCPLSLAIVRLSSNSRLSDVSSASIPLNCRWGLATNRKESICGFGCVCIVLSYCRYR